MQLSLIGSVILVGSYAFAAPTGTSDPSATLSSDGFAAQFSPVFANMNISSEATPLYNDGPLDTNSTLSNQTLNLKDYPGLWEQPDVNHPEVKAAIKQINWDIVPKFSVHKVVDYDLVQDGYDEDKDETCWWTSTGCVKPKISHIPEDLYTCPTKGDWGLTFDDGPYNLREQDDEDADTENPFAEPELYNFLAKENVKSTLFYVGTNVVTYPAAARRALDNGHTICSHTWSHQTMTSQTNEQAVAELYWSLKAIKEATGITTKCWRPPQGDVDDRIRSIAWQMGLRTVIWDRDTEDWAMPAPGGGDFDPSKVDALFEKWIEEEKSGKQSTGIMVLEHELNHATVGMAEKWIPKVKETFNVVSAMTCNGVLQPYWETDFQYPDVYSSTSKAS
ncbi:hypothetical protein BDF21DRAFT_373262 [Thamnidium elegans]|uniref:NodB homology domain-containing protein n=1 Tax=Thamnidium elegans TaxID=101142 RepID=A0A8H7SP11_9FUNG|nr:hypothetical protein INT48_002917 [Thamnidium elegans]KAI8095209.1 hypothetical protein BDF21DRAFT_373262 [Thamnidium elegans]